MAVLIFLELTALYSLYLLCDIILFAYLRPAALLGWIWLNLDFKVTSIENFYNLFMWNVQERRVYAMRSNRTHQEFSFWFRLRFVILKNSKGFEQNFKWPYILVSCLIHYSTVPFQILVDQRYQDIEICFCNQWRLHFASETMKKIDRVKRFLIY